MVAVMHDLVLASRFCSRMLLMHEGRIVADDAPANVLNPTDVERFYRVRPFITHHDEQTIVVPWQALD